MAASTRIDLRPLHVVGAIVSLLLFLVIGGCGGGTMGTQTGEQRVAVVGTVVDARGNALPGVTVEILDEEGDSIGRAKTDANGRYATEVLTAQAAITVQFTSNNGLRGAAAVAVSSSASVTVNAVVGSSGITPIVPTPIPTPTPTTSQGGGGVPTSTPVPPPGATNTPTPVGPTPTPQPLATKTPVVTPTPTPVEEPLVCPKSDAVVDACCAYEFEDLNLFNPPLCKCVVNGSDRCINVIAQYD